MKIRDFICERCNKEFTVINMDPPPYCDDCEIRIAYQGLLDKARPYLEEGFLTKWIENKGEFSEKVSSLYRELFPEDNWFMGMDHKTFDLMSDEYLANVNSKRLNLGVRETNKDGSDHDANARELCEKITIATENFYVYDFIGDVHGDYKALSQLLSQKGYEYSEGMYSSINRRAVFVGDFVDRGTESVKVLRLVKNMCESGVALAVLGNHDWNWIRFNTPNGKGGYLREHNLSNLKQNEKTRLVWESIDFDEQRSLLQWLSNLPFFIEREDFGVVHACWDENAMNKLKYEGIVSFSSYYKTISAEGWDDGKIKQLDETIDCLLCGPEKGLPQGLHFFDGTGKRRDKYRVKWWAADATNNLADAFVNVEDYFDPNTLNKYPTSASKLSRKKFKGIIYFGHYNLNKLDFDNRDNLRCLDIKNVLHSHSLYDSFA